MNLICDFVSVDQLAEAAKVSPRTVRRVLRRLYPWHPASFRWEVPLHRAVAVVERIKRERKRDRKNQFTTEPMAQENL